MIRRIALAFTLLGLTGCGLRPLYGGGSGGPTIDRWRMCEDYLHHGVRHILEGYDHLLFISALVLANALAARAITANVTRRAVVIFMNGQLPRDCVVSTAAPAVARLCPRCRRVSRRYGGIGAG